MRLTLLIAIPLILVSSLLISAFSFTANISNNPSISHSDLIALKKELSNYNPFKVRRIGSTEINLSEKNVNQAAQLFISNYGNIPIKVELSKNYIHIISSPSFSLLLLDIFANIELALKVEGKNITIEELIIGNIRLPKGLIDFFKPTVETYISDLFPNYLSLLETIHHISVFDQKISASYQWSYQFLRQVKHFSKNILLKSEVQNRISVYYEELGKLPRTTLFKNTSIVQPIQLLFKLAKRRTTLGNDAIEEHKSLLLALGIMASGIQVNHLISGNNNKRLRHVRFGRLTLSNRTDLMRHFLISAALTVSTNKLLTNTIGLSKEVDDADGGSGFSFADLLADRAGVAFAKAAISEESNVQFLELLLQKSFSENDIMPSYQGLPGSISAIEFKKNYGSIKDEKYLIMDKEIQTRIEQLLLYRGL